MLHPDLLTMRQHQGKQMTCSHMTNREAKALRFVLDDIGLAPHQQFWSSAQTRDNDHTCHMAGLSVEAITIVSHLINNAYTLYDSLLGALVNGYAHPLVQDDAL